MLSLPVLWLCVSAALAVPAGKTPPIPPDDPSPTPPATIPVCVSTSLPCAFAVSNVAYQKYMPAPGTIEAGLDSMTLAFGVNNDANDISTACSFTNGKYGGQWADNGTRWYNCGTHTIVDGNGTQHVLRTNARFDWNTWHLSVNQTWVCGNDYGQESNIGANVTVLLAPSCTDTSNQAYNYTECSAPNIVGDGFPFISL
ncbi:hypothetical protein BJ166DRAFT_156082 [Pestalotiopsis sp. NC0098]|nr:hypothetical protein BJ166DRAFT_156082 [Pestalotiopsis sp. NC0098]